MILASSKLLTKTWRVIKNVFKLTELRLKIDFLAKKCSYTIKTEQKEANSITMEDEKECI